MKVERVYIPIFLCLVLLYFSDAFFGGRSLAVGDGVTYFIPHMRFVADQYRAMSLPLWNPYVFSGFPLMGAMQTMSLYPVSSLFMMGLETWRAYDFNLVAHYAMAGAFMFLYMRRLGVNAWGALISAMTFGLLGFLPARLQHTTVVTTGAWLPVIIYALDRLRERLSVASAGWVALAVALQALAGHPQMMAYSNLLVVAFIAHIAIRSPHASRGRLILLSALAFGLGVLIASPQLVSTWELSRASQRAALTYDEFALLSFPVHMFAAMLFPFLYGGGYGGSFWGPEGFDVMDGFIGIVPLMLALTAFWREEKQNSAIRFWGVVAVVAILLAMGGTLRPLHQLMYHVPVLNSFRSPSRHWLEVCFALSVLAGYGMDFLLSQRTARDYRRALLWVTGGAIVSTLIVFTVLQKTVISMIMNLNPVAPDRALSAMSLASPAVLVPLAAMGSLVVVLLCIGRWPRAAILLLAIVFFEALSYRAMYAHPVRGTALAAPQGEVFEFLSDAPSGRVAFISMDVPDSLHAITYGIRAIDGYDPLIDSRYAKLLEMESFGYSREWPALIESNLLLSMLATRYVVVDEGYGKLEDVMGRTLVTGGFGGPIGRGLPKVEGYAPVYRQVFGSGKVSIYENLNALPRAYAVMRLLQMESVEELRLSLYAFQMNPRTEAALSGADISRIGRSEGFAVGEVHIVDDGPDRVVLRTSFEDEGFIVLADQHYPGWRAEVDGAPTEIYRVNGVLRGVRVPRGLHEVVFSYRPLAVYVAFAIALLALLTAVSMIVFRRRGSEGKDV